MGVNICKDKDCTARHVASLTCATSAYCVWTTMASKSLNSAVLVYIVYRGYIATSKLDIDSLETPEMLKHFTSIPLSHLSSTNCND